MTWLDYRTPPSTMPGKDHEYGTVQMLIIETTVFIVIANMLADAVQAWLDPTLR